MAHDWSLLEEKLNRYAKLRKELIDKEIEVEQEKKWRGIDRTASQKSIELIEKTKSQYEELIEKAEKKGYFLAARALSHFVTGEGKKMIIEPQTIKKFESVRHAEQTNKFRFERKGPPKGKGELLIETGNKLSEGETKIVIDYWEGFITSSFDKDHKELFYASNFSTLISMGAFQVSKKGDDIIVKGVVEHFWYDYYDFEKDMGFDIDLPFVGNVLDDQGWLLEKVGEADSYKMESTWRQKVEGVISKTMFGHDFKFNWKDE